MSDNEDALDLDAIRRDLAGLEGLIGISHYRGGQITADEMADSRSRIKRAMLILAEVEALRVERDGLTAVIEQAPHARGCSWFSTSEGTACNCFKSAAPSDVLDEVKREAWREALVLIQGIGDGNDLDAVLAQVEDNAAIRKGRS